MSNSTDNLFDLDLQFLPAWAQQPATKNLYADFEGGGGDREGRRRSFPDRGDRPRRPMDQGGPRGPGGPGRGPGQPGQGGRAPFRGRRDDGPRGRRDDQGQDRRPEPRPEAPPLPINVRFIPDDKGVDSLARQIKMTGRAYPLFQIAQMVLDRPERHNVEFSIKKDAQGVAQQPLFLCALDDTLWISEDEALRYILEKHFDTFYQAEKTAIEPPKGTYTFVAQCGLSGVILGPPNHHDYQNRLRKLHAERFSRMPFEVFKSRVKIVRDEAVVKKWIEEQSWTTEFICLNMPEPLRLPNRAEVENHFRTTHLATIIQSVERHSLNGKAARNLRSPGLQRLVRIMWEEQRRFPLVTATILSQQFGSRGLQFFKINKNQTHVAIARPHFLDLETNIVSDGVKRIIAYINEHPRCIRRKLIEDLVPGAAQFIASLPPSGTPPTPPPAEGAAPAAPAPEAMTPPPEWTAAIADLHWLIHQGHVIEFADGAMETAKKPKPKPVTAPAPAPEAVPTEASLAAEAAGLGAPAEPLPPAGQTPPTAQPESAPPAPEPEAVVAEPAVAEPATPEAPAPLPPLPETEFMTPPVPEEPKAG